ncbi:8587_t:CDS:2, partial [Racocetra persica]
NIVRHANARVISSISKIEIQLLQLFGDALNVPECQDVCVTTMHPIIQELMPIGTEDDSEDIDEESPS